jgi:hypothetical protein
MKTGLIFLNINDRVYVKANAEAESNSTWGSQPWGTSPRERGMWMVVETVAVAGRSGDDPFVERSEEEVVELSVAAKESLESGNRKVVGDIQQELGRDRDEGCRHEVMNME